MYGSRKLLDTVVKCPYNHSHLIATSRLQKHIVKCERHYPEDYKVMCPFNATHRLFKKELEEHIISCPARSILESEMLLEPRRHGATNLMACSEISSTIDCTENWDLEIDDQTDSTDQESLCSKIIEPYIYESNVNKAVKNDNNIRAPRGFSEAILREVNEDSYVEDSESIVSSMGIGRGKVLANVDQIRTVGLGRGQPMNENF